MVRTQIKHRKTETPEDEDLRHTGSGRGTVVPESIKSELSAEEMQEVSGGMMPLCSHPRVTKYLGQKKERLGEQLYLWECANCGKGVWCLNVPPQTGGATGTW